MSCALWYCYSNGHWAKAKGAYLATSAGHWSKAKAISYKRTSTIWQTCSTLVPTIATLSNITITKPGAFIINASVHNADKYVWWSKLLGKSWVIWGGRTAAKAGGTADTPGMNGLQFKLVASNNFGSTTSNVITMTLKIPAFSHNSRLPANKTFRHGTNPTFHNGAKNAANIVWYVKKGYSGASWEKQTGGRGYSQGGEQFIWFGVSSAYNGGLIKAVMVDYWGRTYNSRSASVHVT